MGVPIPSKKLERVSMDIRQEVYLENGSETKKRVNIDGLVHDPPTDTQKCDSKLKEQGRPGDLIQTSRITAYEFLHLCLDSPQHLQRETNQRSLTHYRSYPLHFRDLRQPELVVA